MKPTTDLLLSALSRAAAPVTAQGLVLLLSAEFDFAVNKHEVNSALYERLRAGLVQKSVEQPPRWWAVSKVAATKSKPRKPLTLEECERAVWIDFEGTAVDPPTFLGVLMPDGDFTQWVTVPVFKSAAEAKLKGTALDFYCEVTDLHDLLIGLTDMCRREGRPIVAWSSRELVAAADTLGRTSPEYEAFRGLYRDGRVTARRWFKDHDEKPEPDPRTGDAFSLAMMMKYTQFHVPKALGPGNTAERIRYVRQQLLAKGSYDRITPVAKGKWTKVLKHNWHDCHGMRHAVRTFAGGSRPPGPESISRHATS